MNYIEARTLLDILSSGGVTADTLADKLADGEAACRKALDELIAAKTEAETAEAEDTLAKRIKDLSYLKANCRMFEQAERMAPIAKVKEQYPDAIVLLRADGAYHVYNEDAIAAAQIIGLESQQDACNTPVVTLPLEAIDSNLCKFIRAGKRLVIMGEAE